MQRPRKKLPARFYQSPSGKEPAREWLKNLRREDCRVVGMDIANIEYAWPVGKPLCDSLGGGLWEVRSNISGGRIARMIFCIEGSRMVLLHGFIKKSRKTPTRDREVALKRKREIVP